MAVRGRLVHAVRRRTVEPFFRVLDLRFAAMAERIEAHTVNLARHHESINEQIVGAYNEGLNTTRALVRTEGEAVGEYVLAMARIEERILRALEARTADAPLLDAEVGSPRVVDVPHVHARAVGCGPLRVLDIGGHARPLAFELACLGHEVVVLDPQGSVFTHPSLHAVAATCETWRGPDAPFDLVVGLETTVDAELLERLSKWLAPSGEIVVSVRWTGAADAAVAPEADALAARVPALVPVAVARYVRTGATTWAPAGAAAGAAAEADRLAVFHLRSA